MTVSCLLDIIVNIFKLPKWNSIFGKYYWLCKLFALIRSRRGSYFDAIILFSRDNTIFLTTSSQVIQNTKTWALNTNFLGLLGGFP